MNHVDHSNEQLVYQENFKEINNTWWRKLWVKFKFWQLGRK